jgi:hypothetical protein
MFECKSCKVQEERINDNKAEIARLVAQVEMFRKLAYPEVTKALTPQEIEFDRLMSGLDSEVSQDPQGLTQEQIDAEANALLTGSY